MAGPLYCSVYVNDFWHEHKDRKKTLLKLKQITKVLSVNSSVIKLIQFYISWEMSKGMVKKNINNAGKKDIFFLKSLIFTNKRKSELSLFAILEIYC